jgi:predicted Zn-dependent peptidase
MLSLESSHSRMNKLAKDELISRGHTNLEDMIVKIDAITPQQISHVAQDLFTPGKIALTGLGPLSTRQVKALSGQFQKSQA